MKFVKRHRVLTVCLILVLAFTIWSRYGNGVMFWYPF